MTINQFKKVFNKNLDELLLAIEDVFKNEGVINVSPEIYLFLLTFVLLISNNEDDERSYWKNFNDRFDFKPQNDNTKEILEFFKKFCEAHKIPFFDVYQNKKLTILIYEARHN